MSPNSGRSGSVVSNAPRDLHARKEKAKAKPGTKAYKKSKKKAEIAATLVAKTVNMHTPSPQRTRGLNYAYCNDKPPRHVVPRAPSPKSHPVSRLLGQEDIPPSDSDSDSDYKSKNGSGTDSDSDPNLKPNASMEDDDDIESRSQASTVIEDDLVDAEHKAVQSTGRQGLRRMGAIYGDEGLHVMGMRTSDVNVQPISQSATAHSAALATNSTMSSSYTSTPASLLVSHASEPHSLSIPTIDVNTFDTHTSGAATTPSPLQEISDKLVELPLEEVQPLFNNAPSATADNLQFGYTGGGPRPELGFPGTEGLGAMQAQAYT